MTRDEIKTLVVTTLTGIAPEIEPDDIGPAVHLRDDLDLDSMDFLNYVIALHEQTGVEIPETDYGQLATLDGAVAYLAARAPG